MPFGNRFLIKKLREEEAFGIIEALMALTIMSLVLIALLGLLVVSVKAVTSSKHSSVATQIANESIEKIRAMDYELVGVVGGDPSGILVDETRTVSGILYTVSYEVTWVDDSADGTGTADAASDPNDLGHDYKQATAYVYWVQNETTRTVSAVTYVKDKQVPTEPPSVNFILGTYGVLDSNKTPPDGTIFGLDDSPYKEWFDKGTIPLKAMATDSDGDLVTMRFIIGMKTPDGGFYDISPTDQYENYPTCYWNPNTTDTVTGDYIWGEGTHEVTVEVWDAHGNRDAKSIHWIIDREAPPAPENLVAQATDNKTISLTWQDVFDGTDKVERYQIYRKGPDSEESFMLVVDTNLSNPAYSDSDLAEWSTYQYYIKALSPGGRASVSSNLATATTMFGITGTVSANKTKVTIQWNSPSSGISVDRFDIIRNGAVVATKSGGDTQHVDTVSKNSSYTYQVKAYYGGNVVNQSTTIKVDT